MSALRQITVHVVEPKPDGFVWVLSEIEPAAGSLTELRRAPRSESTYHAAMAAGLLALQGLIEDLDRGPRKQDKPRAGRKPQDSAASEKPEAADSPAPASKKIGGFFGFGPVR